MSHENHPQNTHTDTHSTTKCFQAVTIIVMRIIIINSYALVVFFSSAYKKVSIQGEKDKHTMVGYYFRWIYCALY